MLVMNDDAEWDDGAMMIHAVLCYNKQGLVSINKKDMCTYENVIVGL